MGFGESWSLVGLLILLGVAFVVVAFTANRLLAPAVATREKGLTYECGMDPVGDGWAQSHIRYYVFAYLYVIFAVDVLYLFPWATVFASLGVTGVVEMGIFVGFLAVGLLYAGKRGVLTWGP